VVWVVGVLIQVTYLAFVEKIPAWNL